MTPADKLAEAARAFLVVNGQATKEDADHLRVALVALIEGNADPDAINSIKACLRLIEAIREFETWRLELRQDAIDAIPLIDEPQEFKDYGEQ